MVLMVCRRNTVIGVATVVHGDQLHVIGGRGSGVVVSHIFLANYFGVFPSSASPACLPVTIFGSKQFGVSSMPLDPTIPPLLFRREHEVFSCRELFFPAQRPRDLLCSLLVWPFLVVPF